MERRDEELVDPSERQLPPEGPAFRGADAFGLVRGLVGAIAGGVVGFFCVRWIATQGFYAIILPGALAGLGCGLLSGRRSIALGVLAAIIGLAFGVYTEWRFFPFIDDGSFDYFLSHFHQLPPIKLILIGLGAFLAFWFGRGRERRVEVTRPSG